MKNQAHFDIKSLAQLLLILAALYAMLFLLYF